MNLYSLFSVGGYFVTDEYLHVLEVLPNSPAAKTSIQPGDIILEVNGEPVKEDFYSKIGTTSANIVVTFRRGSDIQQDTIVKNPEEPFLEGAGTGLVAYNTYLQKKPLADIVVYHLTQGMFEYDRLILVPWNRFHDPSSLVIVLKRFTWLGLGLISIYFAFHSKQKGPTEK